MIRLYGLGVAVDVDLSDSRLDEDEFRRLWARALEAPTPDTDLPGEVPVVRLTPRMSYETATQDITKAFIGQQHGELLMLHAGAVTDDDGRTLAYVAPSGTGKSTLTRLLAREFGYVTDETVGIRIDTLEVLPYPKPVTFGPAGAPKSEHAPDDIGLRHPAKHPVLAGLAVLDRFDGAPPAFTPLPLLAAIGRIVGETSSLSKLPRPLHALAEVIDRVGGATLISYGEAADVVEWCRERIARDPEPRTDPSDAAPERQHRQPPAGTVALGPVADILFDDGEAAVLLENQLLRLGPVASAIVELLDEPRTIDALTVALEERFGTPEGMSVRDAVEEQIGALEERSVIVRA